MASEEIENLNLSLDIVSNVLKGNDTSTKDMVLNYLLMISSREDDDQLLKTSLVLDLIDVIERNPNDIGELASKVLVNVSSQEKGARTIIGASENAVERLLQVCLNPESPLSDSTSKLLANLTRTDDSAKIVSQTVLGNPKYFSSILEAISNKEYNKQSQRLEYMAHVVGNLSQARDFQNCLLNPSNNDNINRILPVITNSPSSVERFGVASAVYNCLFDSSNHETLMDPPYEVLPTLLLPLAGPEEFDAEDYDKMPLELQYLPDDKKRDDCASTRNIILRALLHLCSTKKVRTRVRDLNTYLILREYHKWEKDRQNLLAAENIIDILIRTEDEIGVDDLTGLNVPDDLKEKFEKMDKDFLTDE